MSTLEQRQQAAKGLRDAAKWWADPNHAFLQHDFLKVAPDGTPTAMCSLQNISYHLSGTTAFPTPSSNPVLRLAEERVRAVAKTKYDICGLNNNSTKEQMIGYFNAAADNLEAEQDEATP